MSKSWDLDSQTKSGNKTDFTKFPVGVTRIRIIDDAPELRWQHWMPEHSRGVTCPGKGCPICEIRNRQKAEKLPQTYSMGRRFAITAINRETNKIEIVDQGVGFFQDVRDLMEELKGEGKSLIDVDLKVKRRGSGKDDTSYRIDIGDEYPLTDKEKEEIKNKPNLADFFQPPTIEQIKRLINGEKFEEVMAKEKQDTADDIDEEIEVQ